MHPERRRHRRILTLKNFTKFLVLLVVFLAGLSIEVSTRQPPDDYGRLVRKEIPRNNDIRPQPPVVTAAPVAEQTAADPLLLEPAAREQQFLSTTAAPPSVHVEGDAAGITIRRASDVPKRPVLAGGIFKQQ